MNLNLKIVKNFNLIAFKALTIKYLLEFKLILKKLLMSKVFRILILFICLILIMLYFLTKQAIWQSWDFSNTGQIGDTIGGIATPIISIIGALLVYYSFQEQIIANRIQFDALSDEKTRNEISNSFEKHQYLLDEVKSNLRNLEFICRVTLFHSNPNQSSSDTTLVNYRGINAFHELVLRLEAKKEERTEYYNERFSKLGTFLGITYVLSSMVELLERIELNLKVKTDIDYLNSNIFTFYNCNLKALTKRLIEASNPKDEETKELIRITDVLKTKFELIAH